MLYFKQYLPNLVQSVFFYLQLNSKTIKIFFRKMQKDMRLVPKDVKVRGGFIFSSSNFRKPVNYYTRTCFNFWQILSVVLFLRVVLLRERIFWTGKYWINSIVI